MKVTKDMIDPQLRLTGKLMDLMMRPNSLTEEKVRKQAEKPPLIMKIIEKMLPAPKGIQTEERWIARSDGSMMRVLVRKPLEPKEGVPGVLHLHGGGYYGGNPDLVIHGPRYIEISDCVMVSPAYRRSVEAPYPAALEDCYTALLWLKENAAELGVRDDQLIVTGESAGGGLTAATTLYARDKGEVNIAFQMPIFPMIDDRNNSESAKDNDAPVWNEHTNELGWKLYLGDLWGTDDVPAYAAPARQTDFTGMPPTYTYVGAVDPFCSETIDYIEKLKAAGVPAEIDVYEGGYHGFDLVKKANVTKRAHERLAQWFETAVEEYTAPQPEAVEES
ncbi:MAG: alpha/beta hydrolase [Acidimicrobiales bacterium]